MIPPSLQSQMLQILQLGHFRIQRMKQLARMAVYWPGIDSDIVNLCHKCSTYVEYQNRPPKQANHPWMLPEKPWSRIHLDHAINFLGSNWLVVVDSYSKYPCIHPSSSVSSKATTDYWNRILHILDTLTPSSQTIQLHSFPRNFNCGVVREGSPT